MPRGRSCVRKVKKLLGLWNAGEGRFPSYTSESFGIVVLNAMAIEIPPGILYLLRFSPHLLSPPLTVYLFNYLSISSPSFLSNVPLISDITALGPLRSPYLALAMAASVPLALTLKVLWDEMKNRLEAWRLGAVLPPRVPDWWPGGLGILVRTARMVKGGYIGESW